MRIAGHPFQVMSDAEVGRVHRGALRILDEMGMEVQNEQLLRALREAGLPVDLDAQRVRFPSRFVEAYIGDVPKVDWDAAEPRVSGSAGVFHGRYHDPETDELVPWTEEALAFYFALPAQLDHVSPRAGMLGCRLPVPSVLEPLYERYYCWKYGAHDSGTIHLDTLCPYVLALSEALADEIGRAVADVFNGTVYLVPPLKLGRHEAYQVAYFWERGLRVRIGDMYLMGATAPVTMAGAVTLNVAEQIALSILRWALFGERALHIGSGLGAIDMRTSIYPYGRPEIPITNLMTIQMARFYGVSGGGHSGNSDAKLPSTEAGAQKALSAIPTLLAGGRASIGAGLLSIDEVCSPIQMVLDNEFIGALKHLTKEFEVTEDAIGLDTILEVGPGGHFLDTDHTLRYFRTEHWQPAIWSREMMGSWLEGGSRLDVDKARTLVLDLKHDHEMRNRMSPALEENVDRIIEDARRALVRRA
jgi:trimethylamine--corrinoid protein Co-methyltransferase